MPIARMIEQVALREESVDRNQTVKLNVNLVNVALREESVDRNTIQWTKFDRVMCRSPRGERG